MGSMVYTGTLITTTCWCGIEHAVPENLYNFMKRQKENGEKQVGIYCPLGHNWTFSGKSKLDEANEQLERVQREKIWAENRATRLRMEKEAAERSASAYKGQATKARKRAAAALCPVDGCGRFFVQLRRHLSTKHPGYDPMTEGC